MNIREGSLDRGTGRFHDETLIESAVDSSLILVAGRFWYIGLYS